MTADRYKFRYRLLASADIIGSTAFKAGQASQSQSWAHVFTGFFDEFPRRFAESLEALDERALIPGCKPSRSMDVWKLVGDEILFHAELGRHEEAAFHAIALKKALTSYSADLRKKHPTLGLKGTIWGAGFPVTNVEVVTRRGDGPEARDFLGPSVDLGFRLAAFADTRRIPVSAEVALFLVHSRATTAATSELQLFLDPPQVLRGVSGGAAYPIFWLDRLDGRTTPEDKLMGRDRHCQHDALLEYLEELFREGRTHVARPFIESDLSEHFRHVPDDYRHRRDKLRADDPDERYREDAGKSQPASGQATEPPLPQ